MITCSPNYSWLYANTNDKSLSLCCERCDTTKEIAFPLSLLDIAAHWEMFVFMHKECKNE